MARSAKPWFYARTGWWTAWIGGKRVALAEGKKSKKAAEDRLKDLQYLARHNPHPDDEDQTVASVIERYMAVVFPSLSEETRKARANYLQDFAEAHGNRRLPAARKDHLQEWLLAHPEWKSDWTKRDAIRAVQTVFIWAADAEIIPKNPFKGIRVRSKNQTELEQRVNSRMKLDRRTLFRVGEELDSSERLGVDLFSEFVESPMLIGRQPNRPSTVTLQYLGFQLQACGVQPIDLALLIATNPSCEPLF